VVSQFHTQALYLWGKSPSYTMDMRLASSQSQPGHGAKEKSPQIVAF
jgi:hypothetical protein